MITNLPGHLAAVLPGHNAAHLSWYLVTLGWRLVLVTVLDWDLDTCLPGNTVTLLVTGAGTLLCDHVMTNIAGHWFTHLSLQFVTLRIWHLLQYLAANFLLVWFTNCLRLTRTLDFLH